MRTKVAIIGAGPAGITAAIQLKRFGIEFLLIEKDIIGGLLNNARLVENYPGFPCGISGPDLVRLFTGHLRNLSIPVVLQEVLEVIYSENMWSISTAASTVIADYLIIASGTKPLRPKDLDIPEDAKARIYYDIVSLRGKTDTTFAIVGAGDAAFDYALSLCERNTIYLLNKSHKEKCLPLLKKYSQESDNIRYLNSIKIQKIELQNSSLRLTCRKGNELAPHHFFVDFLVVAIGREPQLDFFDNSINNSLSEYCHEKGLFLIGDVKNMQKRQASIAIGDGMRAAMEIEDILRRTGK